MLMNVLLLIGVCLCVLSEAFFAVSEISLLVSDKLTLLDLKEKKRPGIMPLLKVLSEPDRISHTLLIGTVLSSGGSTLFMTIFILRQFQGISFASSLVIILCIQLLLLTVFGEIIPRVLFYHRAEEIAVRIASPLSYSMKCFRPVIALSTRFHAVVQSLAGMQEPAGNPFVEDEDLEWIRRFAQGSETLKMEDVRIIRKIFDFSDIRVRNILVPIDQVVSVSENASVIQAMEEVVTNGYTRLPVYRGDRMHMVGLLHALDLFRVQSLNREIADYYRKPFFVQPDALIRDLFKAMQKRGIMMAVVLGDNGTALGIVTMEDILEEIFGEIEDEYDLKDQLFREISRNEYLADGRTDIQELNEKLHLGIPGNGYRTLNGYILHHLRRVPQEGERFTIGNLMFKIELADERQIYKLFLKKLQPAKKGEG
ncbi:MAG: hemolysin family protein [bacterium]